jgi:hypothetical protein
MADEHERIWKEAVVAQLRYFLGTCLQKLRKTIKTSVTIVVVLTKHSNRAPPNYRGTWNLVG